MLPDPPSPRRLEQLLDDVPVGLLVTDAAGTILEANGTLCRWLGCAPHELVGQRKLQELLTIGGRIFHQTHWLPILQMQGSISEVKFELRRCDGGLLTVMLNAVRKASGDVPYDLVSITMAEERNKYERQLLLQRQRADELAASEVRAQQVLQVAESRIRQAVRVGALHLWSADATGTRHFEPSVAALLGRDANVASTGAAAEPGSEPPAEAATEAVTEADFVAAILPADREAEAAAYQAALADPSTVHSWTFNARDARGEHKVLLASGQAFPVAAATAGAAGAVGGAGTQQRFVGVLRDVTEDARKSAATRDRALFAEQMVGIVSHDLRNPLFAITIGASVLARDTALGARHKKVLDSIDRSAQRARRLIDELLDFTLVRVGHGLTVARTPQNAHELVGRCVQELMLAFPGKAIRHVAHGDGGCDADPDRIAQLLGNLVANAVTYGEPGGAITITSTGGAQDIVLAVHNTGTPIPEAMLTRIFEPLIRGGTADTAVRSVGLGLFIVKAIAESHRGAVSVASCAQGGTTFTFAFQRHS